MFSNMKYVYEVYKEGSFSKAAKSLYISQPALSATIKKVEQKVGMPLFDRSANPIQLTECGKQYIKTAEQLMYLEEEFAAYVGNLNELKTGQLSIGGTYLFSAFVVSTAIQKFQEKYPLVNVSLFEGSTPILEEKLFQGELDLLIDNYPLNKEIYDKRFFIKEHLILAVPSKFKSNQKAGIYQLSAEDIQNNVHTRADIPGVPLRLFEEEPFVMLRSHNDTRERVEAICKRAEINPKVVLKLNQLMTVYHLTEKGMGNTILSDTLVKYMPPSPKIIYYKIDDPEAVRNVYFYYRKNKYFTKSMDEFMKVATLDDELEKILKNDCE